MENALLYETTSETRVAYFLYPHWWGYRWFHWYQVCSLYCSWIRWCMIETSSGLPRKSSVIFGTFQACSEIGCFRKMFGNARVTFGQVLESLRKSSEGDWKSSDNRQKRRHHHHDVYIIKRTLHVSSMIWILCFQSKNNISRVSAASWDVVLATRT